MYQKVHRYWNLGVALILLLGVGWIAVSTVEPGSTTSGRTPAPHQGFLAPDFTLNSLDGRAYRLSDLRGQVVLINFWASWCLPCRTEMPDMEEAYQEYVSRGLTILAVNSTVQDKPVQVRAFVEDNRLSFPVLMDAIGNVTEAYQISALPTSFFVDRDGIIQEVVIGGPMPEALLRERIEKLLGGE